MGFNQYYPKYCCIDSDRIIIEKLNLALTWRLIWKEDQGISGRNIKNGWDIVPASLRGFGSGNEKYWTLKIKWTWCRT